MEVMLPPGLWFQDVVCKAVRDLGGSAGLEEITARAIEMGQFSPEQLELPAPEGYDAPALVQHEVRAALKQATTDERLIATSDEAWASGRPAIRG